MYIYKAEEPEAETAPPRVDTTPYGVDTPTPITNWLGLVEPESHQARMTHILNLEVLPCTYISIKWARTQMPPGGLYRPVW